MIFFKRCLGLGSAESLRHSLDGVFSGVNIHDWNTRDFTDSSLKVFITRGNDVTTMLLASLDETVISIGTLVCTRKSLNSWVFGKAKGKTILGAKLLKLSHDTVSNTNVTLGEKTIHHGAVHLELHLDTEVDKVSINEDIVRRTQLGVILEEHRGRSLSNLLGGDLLGLLNLFLGLLLFGLVGFTEERNTRRGGRGKDEEKAKE